MSVIEKNLSDKFIKFEENIFSEEYREKKEKERDKLFSDLFAKETGLSISDSFENFESGNFYKRMIPMFKENVGVKKSHFFIRDINKWRKVEKIEFLDKISSIIRREINRGIDLLSDEYHNTQCEDAKYFIEIRRQMLRKKQADAKNFNIIKRVIKDVNLTIEDTEIEDFKNENTSEVKTSDAILRTQVWSYYIGDYYNVKCPYCKVNTISPQNFECGHVIAKSKGGETTLKNLRPICNICNKSLGTREIDLDKYIVIVDGKVVDNNANQKNIDLEETKKIESVSTPKLKICNVSAIEQKIEEKMDRIFLEFNTTENITSNDFYKLVDKLAIKKLKG